MFHLPMLILHVRVPPGFENTALLKLRPEISAA